MPEPFVQTNTASRKQTKEAKKRERQQSIQERTDLQGLLLDERFRRFAWRLLERTNMFASIWSPNGSELNYKAGKQDVGHWLWDQFEEARPEVMLDIMAERHKQEKD